jgi:hypothetical protein
MSTGKYKIDKYFYKNKKRQEILPLNALEKK